MKISDAVQSLVAAYNDWGDDFLGNPRYLRKDNEVTWVHRVPGIRHDTITASHILQMATNGQYSFQIVEDGSLIQVYYVYDRKGQEIRSASLTFYNAHPNQQQINEEVLLNDFSVLPIDDTDSLPADDSQENTLMSYTTAPIGWIRIDYDPFAKERGITHHDCHLHISSFPKARFVVAGLPTPRQFVEFIVSAFYPTKYKSHCLHLEEDEHSSTKVWAYNDEKRIESVNHLTVPFVEHEIYQQITHFRIPAPSGGSA